LSARRHSEIGPILADLLEADLSEGDHAGTALGKVLADLGEDEGFVTVSKYDGQSPSGTGWAGCCKVPLGEFEPYAIAGAYGPGKYRFLIRRANGRAVHTLTREFTEPRRATVNTLQGALAAAGVAGAAPARELDRLERLETLLHAERAERQRFTETLLTTMLANLAGHGGADVKAMLECFREGRASKDGGPAPTEAVMDAIRLGLELRSSVETPAQDEGDGSMFSKMIPRVMGLLERALDRPAPTAGQLGAPATAPGAPQLNGDPVVAAVRAYAPYLLREASAGHDPELFAEWLLERTPDDWTPALLKLARSETTARHALMAQIDSRLVPYLPWIDRACKTIAELAEPEADDDAPSVPAAVDASTTSAG